MLLAVPIFTSPFLLFDMVTEDHFHIRQSPTYHHFVDQRVTPLLRTILDAEDAHNAAILGAKLGFSPMTSSNLLSIMREKNLLSTTIVGNAKRNPNGRLFLRNCVGLAAGFDKNAAVPAQLLGVGFGSVEVGSITPKPQSGNPKPRVFRLSEDEGIINRYGFNSDGLDEVHKNLRWFRRRLSFAPKAAGVVSQEQVNTRGGKAGALGINLGKNKDQTEELNDYLPMIAAFSDLADYVVVNVSSPNTPGLRGLQDKGPLTRLLSNCLKKLDEPVTPAAGGSQIVEGSSAPSTPTLLRPPPLLFVKISPDMSDDELKDVATVVLETGIDGVIISNTTMSRPGTLTSPDKGEAGGLSGKPIEKISTAQIKKFYELTSGKIPIIGVGGVSDGRGAYNKIRAGASSVQLYSMMSFEGPGVVCRIKNELMQILEEEGYSNVSECVGLDCNRLKLKESELKEYNGSIEGGKKQILMAVGGKIFDVTSSRQFYGPGSPYAVFAGKACTRALVLGSLDKKEIDRKDDVRGLEPTRVKEQVAYYEKKYNQVGVMV
jgi:dihydroorotate dehydrogenase